MTARVRRTIWAALLATGVVGLAACGKRGDSNAAASASASAGDADASASASAPSPSASAEAKKPPKSGPESWATTYDSALGERPIKIPAPEVKAPALACANTIGKNFLREKFKDAYARLLEEVAKGEPQRVAEWAARYRPWYIGRAPLLNAIANGCSVTGGDAFAKDCAAFKAPWERFDTTKPFTCRAIASITRSANGAEIDTLVCQVESFSGHVLVDVPKSARSSVLGETLLRAADTDGLAAALGVRALTGADVELPVPQEPALVEVRSVTFVRRHARGEGFIDGTVSAIGTFGVARELAAAVLSRGDVWQVSLPTEGGASLQLTKRGDSSRWQEMVTEAKERNAIVPCEAVEGRWDRAYCELGSYGLAAPIPLTTATVTIEVRTSEAAPGDGGAMRRPIDRHPRAETWRNRVLELGGFEPIACKLTDITVAEKPRFTRLRQAIAERAGVTEGALKEHLFACVADEKTSRGSIVVRVPSHRIWTRGGFDAERSQRGVVRIDGYVADANGLFAGDLAKFATSTPAFADLAPSTTLRVSGYSKVWRSEGHWVVAFEPECADEGMGCPHDDGFEPKIELLSQPACNVIGYTYP